MLKKMYKGIVNSPEAFLTEPLASGGTVMYISTDYIFPEIPTLAVIGKDQNAETVLVLSKRPDGGFDIERAFEGFARDWQKAEAVARNFTAYDLNALNDNVADLSTVMGTKADLVDGTVPTAQLPEESVTSVAGKSGAVTLDKADVGLASVDNTADADKPISAATQAALDSKSDAGHTHTADAVTMAADDPTTVAAKLEKIEVKLTLLPDDPYESPGRKTLMSGTTTQGFFGEVPTADLVSGTALAAEIGLSQGVAQFDNEPWLKFMLDDKVLFVAKKPYRHTVSWDAINAADAVYGDKDIFIRSNKYKVRLLKTSLTDPLVHGADPHYGGEWNRLMLPIHERAQGGTWAFPDSVGPNDVPNDWGIGYTDAQLHTLSSVGSGSYSWMQETPNLHAADRLVRGGGGVSDAAIMKSSSSQTYFGWRPCLEVIS